jgi:hypothetical protein
MTRGEESDAPPEAAVIRRWEAALAAVAAQELADRGVDEPADVRVEGHALWAYYGPIQVLLNGWSADVVDEDGLFAFTDRWIAFERTAGTDHFIERDHQFVADWRARVPARLAVAQAALDVVMLDVARTTSTQPDWQLAVHEDEPAPISLPAQPGLWITTGPFEPVRRQPLILPELWIGVGEPNRYRPVPEDLDDPSDAINFMATEMSEWVIEEIHQIWPECPRHGHPAEAGGPDGTSWTCPTDGSAIAPIGKLGT